MRLKLVFLLAVLLAAFVICAGAETDGPDYADRNNWAYYAIGEDRAAELPALTDAQMQAVTEIYDRYLREIIHPQW